MSLSAIMTALANKVRQLSGHYDKLGISEMTSHISDANEKIAAQGELIEKIRAAIVGKEAGSGTDSGCEIYMGEVENEDFYGRSITIVSEAEIGDEDILFAYLAEELSISEQMQGGAFINNHNTTILYYKRIYEARYVAAGAYADNYEDDYTSVTINLAMDKSRTFSAQRDGNTIVFTDTVNSMYGTWMWVHIKIK